MPLTIAVQMDPVETIDIGADSTFAIALEAQERGHRLFHYLPGALTFADGRVSARARPMTLRPVRGDHVSLGDPQVIDLRDDVDVVLMRQDPPFNMAYITATHLLEMIHPGTLVVNDPAQVRNAPEKLFATVFGRFMPPTLITADPEEIAAFRQAHGDIILKPLYGNGGAGVIRLVPQDENLSSLLEMFAQLYPEPLMAQRYLPEVKQGDKRIILVDGEPVGAVNRIPRDGEARANFHAGGSAAKTPLTERDREICDALGAELRRRGLIFVGIDIIGSYLTEINVTSPTGVHEINRLDGIRIQAAIVDAIEARAGRAAPTSP